MVTADQPLLRRLTREEVPPQRRNPVDKKALGVAETIVEAVRIDGEKALRKYAEQFGELSAGAPLAYTRNVELKAAFERISVEQQEMLSRTAERIRAFALAQRASLTEVTVPIAGGEAGHTVEPVEVAGCYAPGGRYPLPSTVLMTAVTARAAGCRRVVVASPRPSDLTLAAAYVAHADELYPVGGAHAIGALAYGAGPVAQCDAVVGPGNVYVAAAKSLVAGAVAIDMIAGPSEVLVIADEHASAPVVAADLLAQAEHDPSASAYLISTSAALADAVEAELGTQLAVLPTAPIARQALGNSYCVVVDSLDEAAALSDANAPEHLELHVREPMALKAKLKHYGGLFVGDGAAEVLGDYGAGPNHTLPTGGTARSSGGLCVLTFLRVRTWMRIDDRVAAQRMTLDAAMLGELEGLHGHAAAARIRLPENAEGAATGSGHATKKARVE